IRELMHALPALAEVMTYGNVRDTDGEMISTVVEGIVTRTCVGLPHECSMLDDEAANIIFQGILRFNSAIYLLDNPEYTKDWQVVLMILMSQKNTNGLIRGRACRILLDDMLIDTGEARRQMQLAISLISDLNDVAAWIEGFLQNSGLILIYDDILLSIIDTWVMSLDNEDFESLLPLLRRTFSTFEDPERRQIGRIISGRVKARDTEKMRIDED